MKFSKNEIKDLLSAGLLLSLAFAILLSGGYKSLLNPNKLFFTTFTIAFFTAGIGFLLHELMHKFVAQRFNLWAEFKAFYNMIWLALLFSLFGFILAAPGAVFMRGQLTREKNGKISLAGPVTNIVLALIFLILILILGKQQNIITYFLSTGLTINSLLAAFNMIPIMPFDGAKVKEWNISIYSITTILAVGLFIISFFI
jgi:Zn-dependent protease